MAESDVARVCAHGFRRRRPPAIRAAHRAAQGDRATRRDRASNARLPRMGLLRLLVRRDDGGRAVKVLVTGATGFTGGHLARHLARAGRRVRALVRPSRTRSSRDRRRRRRWATSPTRQSASRGRGRRGRLQHRRALPRGGPAGGGIPGGQRRGSRPDRRARERGRRPTRRALQHRRRSRRRRASAGERRCAVAARRRLSGDQARRRAARPARPPGASAWSSSSRGRAAFTAPAIDACSSFSAPSRNGGS